MGTTELVKYETMDDLERLGRAMVASKYFEDADSISKAIVKILAGKEMGFGPIASMNGIHVIKGKPSIGANLMAAKVKAHPRYDYRVKHLDDAACVIAFFENGEQIGASSFTVQDAQKAGTQNMGKFPRNMLFARAMSNGVKWYCPDVFLSGPVYTPDELGATIDDEGEVIGMPQIVVTTPDQATTDEAQLEADIEHAAEVDSRPFTTPEAAIQWGVITGAFGTGTGAGPHARAAYNKIKTEQKPATAEEMAVLWRTEVNNRLYQQQPE